MARRFDPSSVFINLVALEKNSARVETSDHQLFFALTYFHVTLYQYQYTHKITNL